MVEGRKGDVHVLTVRSVASGILPPSAARWHSTYPSTVLRLHDYSHRRNLEEAMRVGETLSETYGGYIASMTTGQFVLRIPSKRLREVMDAVGEMGVVESKSLNAQDVTDEWVDIESRLAALEKTQKLRPRPEARHRIEHAGLVRPDQLPRLAALGVTVVVQPSFPRYYGDDYATVMGEERADWLYRGRGFLDQGSGSPAARTVRWRWRPAAGDPVHGGAGLGIRPPHRRGRGDHHGGGAAPVHRGR